MKSKPSWNGADKPRRRQANSLQARAGLRNWELAQLKGACVNLRRLVMKLSMQQYLWDLNAMELQMEKRIKEEYERDKAREMARRLQNYKESISPFERKLEGRDET